MNYDHSTFVRVEQDGDTVVWTLTLYERDAIGMHPDRFDQLNRGIEFISAALAHSSQPTASGEARRAVEREGVA